MIRVLLLMVVAGAMGQYTTLPFGLTVPFTGNPIARDSVPLSMSFLAEPWTKILKETIKDDTLLKIDKIVKPEIEVSFKTLPLVRTTDDLCLTHGIGCSFDVFRKEMDKMEEMKPMMSKEEKCLSMGDCSKDVIDMFKMTDPDKLEWLCKTKGIACMEVKDKMKLCMDMGFGCTKEMLDKIKMIFPEKIDWLCKNKGIACMEKEEKEKMCKTMGIGCTKDVLEKIKMVDPEKVEWLCKLKGIGCGEVMTRVMMKEDLCLKSGLGCKEKVMTSDELCSISGLGCKFVKEMPKLVTWDTGIVKDDKLTLFTRSDDLCLKFGVGCIFPKKVDILDTTKFVSF